MAQTIKKSTEPNKSIQGNADKYLAYREAWARIKESQSQGFYLEAITIEESIISDRLSSYFRNVLKTDRQPNSLKRMQDLWKKHHPEPIVFGDYDDLVTALDKWREGRNRSIHAIVNSHEHPEQSIELFLSNSQEVAAQGEKLALAVSQWCDRLIKQTKVKL
jgi:hypothetical protein